MDFIITVTFFIFFGAKIPLLMRTAFGRYLENLLNLKYVFFVIVEKIACKKR